MRIKFAAFAHLEEGKIERGAENRVKCQVLRHDTLHLLSITEGQNFDQTKKIDESNIIIIIIIIITIFRNK
jgi:hypothetical protein